MSTSGPDAGSPSNSPTSPDPDDEGRPSDSMGTTGGNSQCYTLVRGSQPNRVSLVAIATDSWQSVAEFGDVEDLSSVAGLARNANRLVVAAQTGDGNRWIEFDVRNDKTTIGERTEAGSATSDGSGYFSYCPGQANEEVCHFSAFDDLSAGASQAPLGALPTTSRLAHTQGAIWGAWHSTDRLFRLDLSTGAVETKDLTGHDDWVLGFDVAGGKAYLLTSEGAPYSNPVLLSFDLATGQFDGVVSRASDSDGPGSVLGGLYCDESYEAPIID